MLIDNSNNIFQRLPGGDKTIGKKRIGDQIYDKLAYMICSGLLRPGDELPAERVIATTLGVSRETVRSALTKLRDQKMISVAHGMRTSVLGPGDMPLNGEVPTSILPLKNRSPEEVAEARATIEHEIVRLAAARITDEAITRLQSLLEEQAGMIDNPVAFQMSDVEFHMTLYEQCGNTVLFDLAAEFYTYALDIRRKVLQRPGAIAESVRDHQKVVEALKARDVDQVCGAMGHHLKRVNSTTLEEIR